VETVPTRAKPNLAGRRANGLALIAPWPLSARVRRIQRDLRMIAKEPKNEQLICKAMMTLIAQRRGERIISAQPVDVVVRDRPAVEWAFETTTAKFALEHTRIESFSNQIREGKLFAQMLAPLEAELAGKLPGSFFLIVDVGAAKAPRTQHANIRKLLGEWVLANGAGLESEEQRSCRQPAQTLTIHLTKSGSLPSASRLATAF
jgi:hypothetical protein